MQSVEIKRGKLGRFRWFLNRHGKHVAMSRVWGYGSRRACEKAVMQDLGQAVELVTEEDGPVFAGERDFE